jgi:drug/metabolite transporter (DMT)-like permease
MNEISTDTKVVALGVFNAVLMAAGTFFQKLNGVREGHIMISPWIVLATLCYMPTFFIGNWVYQMGGRLSVFVPLTALTYVLTLALGRFFFKESVNLTQVAGCVLILGGVALISRT